MTTIVCGAGPSDPVVVSGRRARRAGEAASCGAGWAPTGTLTTSKGKRRLAGGQPGGRGSWVATEPRLLRKTSKVQRDREQEGCSKGRRCPGGAKLLGWRPAGGEPEGWRGGYAREELQGWDEAGAKLIVASRARPPRTSHPPQRRWVVADFRISLPLQSRSTPRSYRTPGAATSAVGGFGRSWSPRQHAVKGGGRELAYVSPARWSNPNAARGLYKRAGEISRGADLWSFGRPPLPHAHR